MMNGADEELDGIMSRILRGRVKEPKDDEKKNTGMRTRSREAFKENDEPALGKKIKI